jgi:hypothetical protein
MMVGVALNNNSSNNKVFKFNLDKIQIAEDVEEVDLAVVVDVVVKEDAVVGVEVQEETPKELTQHDLKKTRIVKSTSVVKI